MVIGVIGGIGGIGVEVGVREDGGLVEGMIGYGMEKDKETIHRSS